MSLVLFLDDMIDRHKVFMKHLPRLVQSHHAWTANEAITMLSNFKYDQVFLDHDLSLDDIMVTPGGESRFPTGMDVVNFIIKMETPPKHVIVHSWNEPAAREMVKKLQENDNIKVTRVPFSDGIFG